MSSRQSIARAQGVATSKNVERSRNQASNLLANIPVATNIQNGTIVLPNETSQVIERDGSYLVRSPKFAGRYYQVIRTEGRWLTSSKEEKFIPQLIAKVEAFIAEQDARAQAA